MFFLIRSIFAADPGATPTTVVGAMTFGIIGLLAIVRELWKDNKLLRDQLNAVRDKVLETIQALQRETLTVTLDSTARQEESSKVIAQAIEVIQKTVSSRPSNEQLNELTYLLKELKEQKQRQRSSTARKLKEE